MKIKYNSNDDLPLKKTQEPHSMIITVWSAFHENNKYSQQVFLDECLYKLQMLKFNSTNILLVVITGIFLRFL